MVQMAQTLKGRVHAVIYRWQSAVLLERDGGFGDFVTRIEPICQTACRDRNRIGLQADLMGAHAHGIHILVTVP